MLPYRDCILDTCWKFLFHLCSPRRVSRSIEALLFSMSVYGEFQARVTRISTSHIYEHFPSKENTAPDFLLFVDCLFCGFVFDFGDRLSLCNPAWPRAQYMAQDDFSLQIFLCRAYTTTFSLPKNQFITGTSNTIDIIFNLCLIWWKFPLSLLTKGLMRLKQVNFNA